MNGLNIFFLAVARSLCYHGRIGAGPAKGRVFMADILGDAICFAVRAHSGTTRKGTNTPYILHPLEAATIAGTMTDDQEVIAAAALHDVVEDTPTTLEEIRGRFGGRVAALVAAESENKRRDLPAGETWKLRKQETVDALRAESDPDIKIIALADKLSNIRAMVRDERRAGAAFWERFNQKDKAQHGWYYRSVAEATAELSDFPAWQEYMRLVEEVFG